jgi:antigen flippase
VAKGRQTLFFLTELAWTGVSVGAAWLLLPRFGVQGAGMAFFLSYVFHAFMIYAVVRGMTGFRWSPASRTNGAFLIGVVVAAFCAQRFLPGPVALGLGTFAVLVCTIFCARQLAVFIPAEKLGRPAHLLLLRLRILPGGTR